MISKEAIEARYRFYERRRQERASQWYVDDSGIMHIPLTRGYEALIDPSDREIISPFVWTAIPCSSDLIYAKANVREGMKHRWPVKFVGMHQVILDVPAGVQIDHKNRNGLDCRRQNLRIATPSQNGMNRIWPKGKKSPYRGVAPRGRKWVAAIQVERRLTYLGIFNTPEEAAVAYNDVAIMIHGEFARLNEIGEQR